ncbi:uncharacterized protein PHACADRAFT_92839 [Phanerochaete carnosa HHB-10118-sp]|uniref:E3 ubiquitin-protein ligase listerin n=1 Tax=Phanerochaete carnosa (strain HHB-10118-sp) TaxID=650164 RepID=K5WBA7_PHACS|nr:uncharacterized protein PHACADRAFT_92839 [Phanerochaete carnosa HHB-10118-sp]EKM56485.1 hypothetical protein PHACADRAFT_92839 [Phanerochaete carnosa HHB-10118-sp]
MAKGKSSASSGTRKKHARKAAAVGGLLDEPQAPKEKKQKGKEKGSKRSKEPRKKVYIPPAKPIPAQPDPLDTLGIAQRIPADLLVVLRKLAKKDSVTKRRALEDFHADWVEKSRSDESVLSVLEVVLPVWLHHVPALFLHPSRRVRQLAINLHVALLGLPPLGKEIAFLLSEGTSSDHVDFILGSWLLASYDVDRQVSAAALGAWNAYIALRSAERGSGSASTLALDSATFLSLWEFAQRVLLDPSGVYLQINPPQLAMPLSAPQSRKGSGKNTPVPRRVEEPPTRTKADEEEESETDRKARMRISGFGALEWMLGLQDEKAAEGFISPLDNIALWSALYSGQHPPFVQDDEFEAFGWNQPGVRKACWGAVQALLKSHKGHFHGLEQSLSIAVLRSAWVEPDAAVRNPMWQPLLTFLKEYPTAWETEARGMPDIEEEDESDSEDEADVETPKAQAQLKVQAAEQKITHSQAYDDFRQFLELGCMGSPVQAYPAVIIVLSTIPPMILATIPTPISTLFDSFWAAVDGQALSGLDRVAASVAFLSALLECVVFMVRRLRGDQAAVLLSEDQQDGRQAAIDLVREQFKRVWEEISSERLKTDENLAATSLSKTLMALYEADEELFRTAWGVLSDAIKVQLITSQQRVPSLIPATLKIFRGSSTEGSTLAQANDQLINDVIYSTIRRFEEILDQDESIAVDQTRLRSLVIVLDAFGTDIFADEGLASAIDATCTKHAYRLLVLSPDVLFVYLAHRDNSQQCVYLWTNVLQAISERQEEPSTALEPLLGAAEQGVLPNTLRPAGDELDAVVGQLLVSGLSGTTGSSQSLDLLRRVLLHHQYFIRDDCLRGLVSSICSTFAQHAEASLREEDTAAGSLPALFTLLDIVTQGDVMSLASGDIISILPKLFLFSALVPTLHPSSTLQPQYHLAGDILSRSWVGLPEDIRHHVSAVVQQRLQDILLDLSVPIKPSQILRIVTDSASHLGADLVNGIFPSREELDRMLSDLPTYASHPSFAVIDPLVLPGDWDDEEAESPSGLDAFGYSTYARVVLSLLLHFLDDRDAAKQNVWALHHFQALALYAKDVIHVPSMANPVFGKSVGKSALEDIVSKVEQLTAYLLNHSVDDGWFARATSRLSSGKVDVSDQVEVLFSSLINPLAGDTTRESRVLHSILRHVLPKVTKEEADVLIGLARTAEKKAPRASLAIVYAVTQYAPEPPRLDRLRNELAAGLLGVSVSKVNTEGLWLLRRLAAIAPDPESDIVYLPTNRAVNLMKPLQQWITSDEDLDEEVEYQMTLIFVHLAPILQTVPGAHWDLIFDVVENNLENSSLGEASSLPLLYRTLQLVIAIEDLSSTTKTLRTAWQEHRTATLTLVRDLVVQRIGQCHNAIDTPLGLCRELALSVIQDLPESLVDKDAIAKVLFGSECAFSLLTLLQMCHLLLDASEAVPKMAYKILQASATKYTEHLVLEASVDSEATVPLNLPPELVQLLQSSLSDEDAFDSAREQVSLSAYTFVSRCSFSSQKLFGHMLSWMLVFDLFINASLKVKIEYMNHLRREGLVADYFLPLVFNTLGLYEGMVRAFKLDIWSIDEYYLDLTSSEIPLRLPLLAAHLYYRALRVVPGLVRSWLADCRDRQLNGTVTAYTSTHFSPAIIRAELAQIRDPVAAAELLADEHLKVRVASSVHEVTASYAVDEYELELRLRLPSDWPLHAVEVTDAARVGVTEDRWRSWVLGVQQILTFRGGSIVDGLAFFKKNVVSHFEGQSECAICYSMISAMDGSLPKKPCKTCKNKFHSGCLYKWFNSSHSSSCPLCRSEIIQ